MTVNQSLLYVPSLDMNVVITPKSKDELDFLIEYDDSDCKFSKERIKKEVELIINETLKSITEELEKNANL